MGERRLSDKQAAGRVVAMAAPRRDEEEARLVEEVQFWRRLVRWWEEQNGVPASPRMRQALEMAEQKLRRHRVWAVAQDPQGSGGTGGE